MTDPLKWETARHEWDDVTRISPLTGQSATMRLAATPEQWAELGYPPALRRNIQTIVPHWTPEQREFYMTGYTEADWAEMFPPEDDDLADAGYSENLEE